MKKEQIGLLVVIMILVNGCYYNEIDPCRSLKPLSADFRVYNELSYYDLENGKHVQKIKQVEEDTFLLSYVTFEAFETNADSYEWTIGQDTRKWTDKKFTLLFKDDYVINESPISVKLKIKKRPDLKCFPNDPGVDSVTHNIYFLPNSKWPVYGKYLGSDNTDPNNKYTIEIFRGIRFNETFQEDLLKNLPQNCTDLYLGFDSSTAFEFALGEFDLNGFVKTPDCVFRQYDKKIGHLKLDRRTIVIEYEFTGKDESDASLQKRIFTGILQ